MRLCYLWRFKIERQRLPKCFQVVELVALEPRVLEKSEKAERLGHWQAGLSDDRPTCVRSDADVVVRLIP